LQTIVVLVEKSVLYPCIDRWSDVSGHVRTARGHQKVPQPPPPPPELAARAAEISYWDRDHEPRIEDASVRLLGKNSDVAREQMAAPAMYFHGWIVAEDACMLATR